MTTRLYILLLLGVVLTGAAVTGYLAMGGGGVSGSNPDDTNLVASGNVIYAEHCAACHGKNLEGQVANWRQQLADGSFPAPPHDASGHTWHHPDDILFKVTKFGRLHEDTTQIKSNMPAFEDKLSDADIWAVLSYIKSRWPAEIRQRHDSLNDRYHANR